MAEKNAAPAGIGVILPSLNPMPAFDQVVDSLAEMGFSPIVLVDDGSAAPYRQRFTQAAQRHPQCRVLRHDVNRGKGAALKTALDYLRTHCPDCTGAVTVDGDGQHRPLDVLRCAAGIGAPDVVIMGSRDFSGPEIPAKSRWGNRITRGVFRLFCGLRLSDTQTGLRGFPAALFPQLLEVRGERYDYETNVLLELSRRGVSFREIPIETVYEDGNSASHFRPVLDSLRIYRFLLLYIASSLSGSLADLLVFYLVRRLTDGVLPDAAAVLAATAVARALSSFLNFNLNRAVVFHGQDGYARTLLRYYALCVPQLLLSAGLVALLSRLTGAGASLLATILKFFVDTFLFFFSYRIQRRWVFRDREDR